MPDFSEELALQRVRRRGVAKLGVHWLDGGRPVPCFLAEALDKLTESGMLILADPDPHNSEQRRVTLTNAGTDRYAALAGLTEQR